MESGGVLYQQISKGGSTQFHGTVYDYFQNTALNAAPYDSAFRRAYPSCTITTGASTLAVRSSFRTSGGCSRSASFYSSTGDQQIKVGGAANTFETIPTPAMMPEILPGRTQSMILPHNGWRQWSGDATDVRQRIRKREQNPHQSDRSGSKGP